MNKLTKRLELISKLVDERVIADVGCDHGKLTNYLFENNRIDFAYISDISSSSLQKAIDLIGNKYNYKAICCDGLSGYTENLKECIIAGMGGFEIIKIIEKSPINVDKFILSAQHNEIELKKYMLSKNYNITFDIIILDKGKFYNIIKCEKASKFVEMSEYDLYFGKDNFNSPNSDIKLYVDRYLNKFKELALTQKDNEIIKQKLALFEKAKK